MSEIRRTMLFEECIYPSAYTNRHLRTEEGGEGEGLPRFSPREKPVQITHRAAVSLSSRASRYEASVFHTDVALLARALIARFAMCAALKTVRRSPLSAPARKRARSPRRGIVAHRSRVEKCPTARNAEIRPVV